MDTPPPRHRRDARPPLSRAKRHEHGQVQLIEWRQAPQGNWGKSSTSEGGSRMPGLRGTSEPRGRVERPQPLPPATHMVVEVAKRLGTCLLYTSPSPRDGLLSRMP